MTEVLVALVGLVPAVLGFLNSRRRQLTIIEQEMAILKGLPAGMKAARMAMRKEVAQSVSYCAERRSRRVEIAQAMAYLVGWLFLVIGYNLYKGEVPANALRELREGVGLGLTALGALLLTTVVVTFIVRGQLRLRLVRLRFTNWRLRREVSDRDARIDALRAKRAEQRLAASRLYEETDILIRVSEKHGLPVSFTAREAFRTVAATVMGKESEIAMPIDDADYTRPVLEAARRKRQAFKRRMRQQAAAQATSSSKSTARSDG